MPGNEEKTYTNFVFRVGKASLVHRDPWVRKETQAEMDSMGYLGGQVRRESLAFLVWTELRVWTDQEGFQGLENIVFIAITIV